MATDSPAHRAQLDRSLLEGPGASTRAQREAALRGGGEGPLGEYARQIEQAAYKVTPEQVAALHASHGDDVVFELTLCAAHGAARRRLDAGLRALDEAFGDEP